MLVWVAAGALMFLLDGQLDVANLALLLVLASALSSIWLPAWAGMATSAVAVLGFNWFFVPPRFTFQVDLQQNALLLAVILLVNWIIAGLVVRQRRLAEEAQGVADRESRMRQWADMLRDAVDPAGQAESLRVELHHATGCQVVVAVVRTWRQLEDNGATVVIGEANEQQRSGLALCIRDGKAMGAGCGRYDELLDTYLPLRGRGITLGAALIVGLANRPNGTELCPHLQALCDQMGSALHRSLMTEHERLAREEAQLQSTRNALLAAISHDYRTPLATIVGAASALKDRGTQMDPEQRERLSAAILEEGERLARLTQNTLQLARLDAPAVTLSCDWESAEEIVGAALQRARRRPDGHRVSASAEPDLPLLWCDPMLISQLLDNLLDNSLKYSPGDAPVELHVRQEAGQIVLAVNDRGPGIAPIWKQKVFEIFQRAQDSHGQLSSDSARGVGVGLAVCQAIARIHQGDLQLIPRGEGGCTFECRLPIRDNALLTSPTAASERQTP
jgi:two-component system sensor histidine kinase KdpD